MAEKFLLKISLIIAIVGIVGLFLVLNFVELDPKLIDRIDSTDLGNKVKLKGFVSDIHEYNKTRIIEIEQPSKIEVIVFKDKNLKNFSIAKGESIEVIGQVEEYQGKYEVIAQRIRVIDLKK